MNVGDSPRSILSVSDLTRLIRDRLEQEFPDLWVEGEITNIRTPVSGHVYLTLKDHHAQMKAVVFRAQAQRVRFDLKEGLQVLVRGQLTVYEPRGDYQLRVEYLEPKGVGALQIQFEQLKEKLKQEGLFDETRKRELPWLPRRVGVVTSLTGAALKDILAIVQRRCPILGVVIVPVPVQGEGAGKKIAEGIRCISQSGLVDVIIVGRGGGSWEDLWSFNEETVVRAIAASNVPVVSAVGHEIDATLADFAADRRAPTPSAAAEVVAPSLHELSERLLEIWCRQEIAIQNRLQSLREQALTFHKEKSLIEIPLLRQAQRVDDLMGRLRDIFGHSMVDKRQQAVAHWHALGLSNPLVRVRNTMIVLRQLMKHLPRHMEVALQQKRDIVKSAMALLDSLSPLAILGRGYAIVHTLPDQNIVRDAREVRIGQEVRTRLKRGELVSKVQRVVSES